MIVIEKKLKCASCSSRQTNFLGTFKERNRSFDVYKCIDCKKYTRKESKRDPEVEKVAPEEETKENVDKNIVSCVICKKTLPDDKVRKRAITCCKECSKIYAERKKDEYHKKRRENKKE